MKELPLFDDTVPITCIIDSDDRPGRRELLERMRASTLSIERTDFGLVISFSPEEAAVFKEFADLEKQCCAFFGFAMESVNLRWEAPPSAIAIMESVYRFFSDPAYPAERILV